MALNNIAPKVWKRCSRQIEGGGGREGEQSINVC